jgi:hypothetical protein
MVLIPLEKILTISATEYCTMKRKSLRSYVPVGVFFRNTSTSHNQETIEVPEGTEVVVAYSRIIAPEIGEYFTSNCTKVAEYGTGTALIPKRKQKEPQLPSKFIPPD